MVIIAIPLLILALLRRAAALPGGREATAGEGARGARAAARSRTTSCSTSSGSTLRPARRSGTRGRSRRTRSARSTCRSPAATPASARASSSWTDGDPRLEILRAEDEPLDAVLEEVWARPAAARAASSRSSSPSSSASPRSLSAVHAPLDVQAQAAACCGSRASRSPTSRSWAATSAIRRAGPGGGACVPVLGVNAASLRARRLRALTRVRARRGRSTSRSSDDDEADEIEARLAAVPDRAPARGGRRAVPRHRQAAASPTCGGSPPTRRPSRWS